MGYLFNHNQSKQLISMKQVTLSIINSGSVIIAPYTATFEGKDLAQSIGKALMDANVKLTKQYDAPVVVINNVELTSAEVKKVQSSFWDFQLNFGIVRESILAQSAFNSEESMTEYMRHTDRNGVYKNVKSFSVQQVAAQAKEQLRLTRDLTRWVKEDAKASVVPQEVQERRLALAEAAKQKRIAAKK
jgi:hypothetical protein